MGIFDMVHVPCPNCGKPVEFQSKACEDECYMRRFTLADAPREILLDIMNWPEHCEHCGQWLTLIDPAHPPDWKPDLRAAKTRTPENPKTHFQGMRWWPDDEPFTFGDLTEPVK